jgi:hypothetical protein
MDNRSFLSKCVEKIEKDAVFRDKDSLFVKRQKSDSHVTAQFLETNPLAQDLV